MRYASVKTWAEYLKKHERVQIGSTTIIRRLKKVGKIGVMARASIGEVLKSTFYSEGDVREVCADLLVSLPKADKSGFFEIDNIRYGAIANWSKELNISIPTIMRRMKENLPQSIKGKGRNGSIVDFYAEPDIRSLCADFLAPYQADKSGFFEQDGIRYGSVAIWSKELNISIPTIVEKIEKTRPKAVKGISRRGTIKDFYAEPDMRSLRADLLEDLPQSDRSGFCEKGGVQYGTIPSLAEIFEISINSVSRRLRSASIQPTKGKRADGNITNFYPRLVARSACEDLLKDIPQADKSSFFKKHDIRYGTTYSLAKILGVSKYTITSILRFSSIQAVKGKRKGGQITNFYPEPAVRQACVSFLARRQKTNPKAA